MPGQYLHGIDVVDVATGTRPINNVNMSTIGLVCTAPNAALGVVATLSIGLVASNNALTFDALSVGATGNTISVLLRNPRANAAPLAVSVSGTVITVDLATDATGLITSTATQVLAAIAAHAVASLLVVVSHTAGSTGAGVVAPTSSALFLSGGVDEAFPLNTPVRIASRTEAAALDTTGAGLGTGPAAIDDIFDQGSFAVVVVRVAEGATVAATKANVIGGVSVTGQRTGLQALLDAESVTGAKPKVLCAPGFTHDAAVVTEFVAVANRLLAMVVADGTNTTDADAINYRGNFGSPRVWLVDPWCTRFDVISASNVTSPASARFAAVLASRGYWESPSNQPLNGVAGTARPIISSAQGDANSTANFLNENQVATIIRDDNYRVWGSRTCSDDPRFAFVSTVRTDDAIAEAMATSHKWAIDQGITKNFIEAVVDGINAYLQHEVALGHLIGGKAWVDAALNTPESLANGHIYFDYDFTDVKTAEHITMRKHLVNDYLKGLFK
jgi:phage tail sheath protein FI